MKTNLKEMFKKKLTTLLQVDREYVRELLKRKDLIIYLVISGLKSQHKNSFLGYFWWLLDPLLGALVYYFVVVIIFKRGGGGDYGLYLIAGMIVWRWLEATVTTASRSIVSKAGIITQVCLPKANFPIGTVLSQLINFCFGLLVIAVFLIIFKTRPGITILWLPFIMFVQFFFLMAISLLIAYFSVFIRDVEYLLRHLMRLWFFMSPVIWTVDRIPERFRGLMAINPMTHFLASYRNIFMYRSMPDFFPLVIIFALSSIFIAWVIYHYSRYEHKIIKAL
ncbi:MAG: ABC transporter permease [Dissulfuribacterales bacterium]